MKYWHIEAPEAFQKLRKNIDNRYPTLRVVVEGNVVYIRGGLILKGTDGKELGRYSIEIQIPDDFPKGTPIVREVAGRIPKIIDRHFNPRDETACLFFRDAKYKYYPQESTIVDFIEGPVKSFFLWQTDYDLNRGKSTLGEMGHGVKGIVEFYSQELGIKDVPIIVKFLDYLTAKKVKRNWRCYCGSGRQLRYCHIDKLNELREKILRSDAKKSLEELRAS